MIFGGLIYRVNELAQIHIFFIFFLYTEKSVKRYFLSFATELSNNLNLTRTLRTNFFSLILSVVC